MAGADPAELFVLREMEMQAVLLVPLVVEGGTWGLDRGLRRPAARLPRGRAPPGRARRGADRRPARGLRARGASAARLPRDACLALERARGEGRGHQPAHRRGRPARRRRRGGARPRPRGGAQRRAGRGAARHRQGSRARGDPEQARLAHGRGVERHADASRGRRADPAADPVAPGDPPDRAPPPRALGRGGLPGQARGTRDPARGPDRRGLRRLPGDDRGPAVPGVARGGGSA